MIRNSLKIAYRNIKRHKGYSFINVAGLSIGIALFILIMLFVQDELSYDKFNENYERIYRIEKNEGCVMPSGIGHILEGQIPEIEKIVRFYPSFGYSSLIKYEENYFEIPNATFADRTVFDVFTFPFIQGNPETVLQDPFSIVLTEETAKKIFGDKNPVGQTIVSDNRWNFTVTGIIQNIDNFHFPIDAIASFMSWGEMYGQESLTRLDDGYQHPTYFLLPKIHDAKKIEEKVDKWLNARHHFGENPVFRLRSLKDLYFVKEKLLGDQYQLHGNINFIRIFIIVAVFIILIACVNFVNITTSKASHRAKEVGTRKVVGASRRQLISQFLLESVLTSGLALIFGLFLAELLLPAFNRMISSHLALSSFFKFPYPLLFISGIIGLGLIAGIYPAFYLSSFLPHTVLKGQLTRGTKAARLRKGLVVFQFSVSIILIVATATIFRQLYFMKRADLGFEKEYIVTLDLNRQLETKKKVLKDELLKSPNISDVTFSCRVPGEIMWNWTSRVGEQTSTVNVNAVDPDFFQTYRIDMVEGRNFSWEIMSDKSNRIVANEAAVKFFGLDSPVGQRVDGLPNKSGVGQIIGVVKDFHFNSLHSEINPVFFYWLDWPHTKVSVRISMNNAKSSLPEIERTIGYIKEKWEGLCPDYPFDYSFLDESFDKQYKREERLSEIFISFAALAIFIACLGLFAIASFMTERRTKEIGVRKVLGATVPEIVFLLSREFLKWVLIANVIAWPVAYLALDRWLQNFAYRTSIGADLFILSAFLAFVIALLTVSYQTIKTAVANPVEALRYE